MSLTVLGGLALWVLASFPLALLVGRLIGSAPPRAEVSAEPGGSAGVLVTMPNVSPHEGWGSLPQGHRGPSPI